MSANIAEKYKYRFFTVGALGTFMATLDGSILGVALPTIADTFGASIDLVAWVILAYSLTMVSLMMVFGVWAGRRGYAFAYKFGYIFFLGGSILCVLSTSIYFLIGARIIQAIGGAMFQAIGPGMVTQVFGEKERGKGIGLMVMMVALGLMTGPVVGGYLLSSFPWQSIFAINIPITLVGLFLTFKYFKMLIVKRSDKPLKLFGTLALSAGLLCLMIGLSMLKQFGFSDYRVWLIALLALTSLGAFLKFESNPKTSLIGLVLFKNKVLASSLAAMMTLFISMSGSLILIPFYLERIKGLSPKEVGFYLIILPVLMLIIAPLSGRLSDKIGFRTLTLTGLAVNIAGLYFLSGLNEFSSSNYLILALVLVGFGVATFNTPNSSAIMGTADETQRPTVSGLMSTTRNIAMAIGVSMATALFAFFETINSNLGSEAEIFAASYQSVAYVTIGVAVIGLPMCLIRGNR